jgi:hypothetical protein
MLLVLLAVRVAVRTIFTLLVRVQRIKVLLVERRQLVHRSVRVVVVALVLLELTVHRKQRLVWVVLV